MNKFELAEMLERFVGDKPDCGPWEFDDFTSVKTSTELEPYRRQLLEMEPPFNADEIRDLIRELRTGAAA